MNKETVLSNFINFILSITYKPEMYDVHRVEDIDLIILGYECANNHHLLAINESNNIIRNFIEEFKDFTNGNIHSDESDEYMNLPSLIRLQTNNDSNSLQLFATIFKNFLETKMLMPVSMPWE